MLAPPGRVHLSVFLSPLWKSRGTEAAAAGQGAGWGGRDSKWFFSAWILSTLLKNKWRRWALMKFSLSCWAVRIIRTQLYKGHRWGLLPPLCQAGPSTSDRFKSPEYRHWRWDRCRPRLIGRSLREVYLSLLQWNFFLSGRNNSEKIRCLIKCYQHWWPDVLLGRWLD